MRVEEIIPLAEITKAAPLYDIEEHYDGVGEYIVYAGIRLAQSEEYLDDARPERLAGAAIAAGIALGWKMHKEYTEIEL